MSDHQTPTGEPLADDGRSTNLTSNHSNRDRVLGAQSGPFCDAAAQTSSSQPHEQPSPGYTRWLEVLVRQQSNFLQWISRGMLQFPAHPVQPGPHPLDPNFEIVPKAFVAQALQKDAELCRIHESLTKRIEEYEKLRARLQTSARELSELRGIKGALNEQIRESEQIKEHWRAAVAELSDLKSSNPHFMVDDAEMTAKWKKLQYATKNLARSYLCHIINPEQLSDNQKELLELVTPFYGELSARGSVHLVFQSLIWMRISERILQNPTRVWGRNVSKAADTIFQFEAKSPEDHQAWIAQTGEIVQNGTGISNTEKQRQRKKLHSMISQFMPEEILSTEKHVAIIDRGIEGIIDKAMDLAVIFNQSRSWYVVGVETDGKSFNSATMEHYDEECDAASYDLMISPALFKFGNSLGKDYDQRLVLAKSSVYSFNQDMQQDEDDEESLIEL
ncbi:hypothetical protein F5Y01DRAFT_310173 [Xylaria sp. FL0043]|nr:hypothetical protein F5Y01DRAFT_310173 [Xylaria sp. FL0043]